jgi:hypothetical protein
MALQQTRIPGINQRVLFETASQRIRIAIKEGVPTGTVTVALYDPRYEFTDTARNPIVSGSATTIYFDCTLSGAAGPGESDPRNVPVDAMDSYGEVMIGDEIIMENSYHQQERVTIAKWGTTSFGVADPLVWTYAHNDTAKSAMYKSPVIPTAWVSDINNLGRDYIAQWTYTVDQITYVTRSRFDLTREIQDTSVEDSVLLQRFPDLKRFAFKRAPDGYLPLIKAAQRDVDALMWQRGFDPNLLRSNERLQFLVEKRAHLLIAENGIAPSGRDVEEYVRSRREEWEDLATQVTEAWLKIPYDTNNDGLANDDDVTCVYLER